jgi:hypothetical protein
MGLTDDAPQTKTPLLLRGGASIPSSIGWLSASAPLVKLEASQPGITLTVRSRLIRTFFGMNEPWTVAWDEIDHVLVARRTVVIVPKHGRNCRFGTLSARPMQALFSVLRGHGVTMVATRTTVFKLFTGRPAN